ncbi:MAG: sulfotransferase [Euryhalocaulis sp.]|uniref:tetratricopeptide repeat-containing sulfotransferase family protein n=1 Tax=Euryhalocaulis sp. TaxID=2744307 RepID=UPI0017EEDED4|nr:tetratricopeptide repeat-containing sulfotransferase family protein [Euryhalocaulis sp.]MBA4801325.1 sulfotransferase [Euryhalocaulis sp.]
MMTSPDGKSRTADLTEVKAALAAGDRGRLAGLLETMSRRPLENLKGADLATLGAASLFTGNVDRAEPWLARAVAAHPGDLSALHNLGACKAFKKDREQAALIFREVLAANPAATNSRHSLVAILTEMGRHAEAAQQCTAGLVHAPDDAVLLMSRATARYQLADFEGSLADCEAALQHDPSRVAALALMGSNLLTLGDREGAADAYARACRMDPSATGALRSLVENKLLDNGRLKPLLDRVESAKARFSSRQLCEFNFAKGRVLEKAGNLTSAHKCYADANALAAEIFPYIPSRIDALKSTMLSLDELAAAMPAPSGGRPGPIFVIGLPRSGTSLVEQILSSHSSVAGCGETLAVRESAYKSGLLVKDALPRTIRADAIGRFAENYIAAMESAAKGKPFFVDKMPANFQFAGLIARAFPDAPILHCTRDLRDIAVSAYTRFFPSGLSWTYSWRAITHYFAMHRALMDEWERRHPGRIRQVSYSSLVTDPDAAVRGLLEHCGLPWEEAALTPHRNARPVRTASVEQVRQPIHAGAIGGWRPHAPYMAGFLDRYDAASNSVKA